MFTEYSVPGTVADFGVRWQGMEFFTYARLAIEIWTFSVINMYVNRISVRSKWFKVLILL
jgi:hypothetical protein